MPTHELRLVYDGLDAAQGLMPSSMTKQIVAGAQEFLGAHAFFLTEGRVPTNITDRGRYFRMYDMRQRQGSWEALFQIDVLEVGLELLKQYAAALTKDLATEAALATKLGLVYLCKKSYDAWKAKHPLRDPLFDRIEPALPFPDRNGAPLVDVHRMAEQQRELLYGRVRSSMSKMTAPLGRAASDLDLWLDGHHLDHVRRRVITEEDIEQAVLAFRQSLRPARRF